MTFCIFYIVYFSRGSVKNDLIFASCIMGNAGFIIVNLLRTPFFRGTKPAIIIVLFLELLCEAA